jgi:hypothetical protein
MSITKYGDLISRAITKKSKHPQVKGPKIEFGGEKLSGGPDLDISWYSPSEPFAMNDEIHTHDFDEYLCFLPGNPSNLNEYQAEIEISLGRDGEKHVVADPAIIYLPKGLPHGRLSFKKTDKPVSYMKICLSPRYSTTPRIFETPYKKYIINPMINNNVIRQCFYVNDELVGEEEKIVQNLAFASKATANASLVMHWYSIKESLVLYQQVHSHEYKQYQLFMGGNPTNVEDFDSDVEISLGEEAETHVIDSTAMVHIKEDLVHRQINFKRVGKPIVFVNFFLVSDDQKRRLPITPRM